MNNSIYLFSFYDFTNKIFPNTVSVNKVNSNFSVLKTFFEINN